MEKEPMSLPSILKEHVNSYTTISYYPSVTKVSRTFLVSIGGKYARFCMTHSENHQIQHTAVTISVTISANGSRLSHMTERICYSAKKVYRREGTVMDPFRTR